jgi:nicotinate phosphoribosyltransferase
MSYDGMLMGFLDNDLYKFSMMMVVFHQFPQVEAEFEFKCRNKNFDTGAKLGQLAQMIEKEINKMKHLVMTKEEKEYLKTLPFLKDDYIDFLENFRFNPEKHVNVHLNKGELAITIKGKWLNTILYEVPILAIVSEIATKQNFDYEVMDWKKTSIENLDKKVKLIKTHKLGNKFKLICFGTRRRASAENQDMETRYLNEQLNLLGNGQFVGTSNVHLAMKYGLSPRGTMAHEFLQAFQVLSPISTHLESALNCWVEEYRGNLSIALTDSITTDVFLKSFDLRFAKIFDGVRHDSGCPFEFGDKIIKHYCSLGIDSSTKNIVFSDALDVEMALKLLEYFDGRINVSFGIGTNLTNDIGIEPTNIVIKMVKCNGMPVAKISDNPIKSISSSLKYIEYLKEIYNIR